MLNKLTNSQVRCRELKKKAELFDKIFDKLGDIEKLINTLNPNDIKVDDTVYVYGGSVDRYTVCAISNNGMCLLSPVKPSWSAGWDPTFNAGDWVPLSSCQKSDYFKDRPTCLDGSGD